MGVMVALSRPWVLTIYLIFYIVLKYKSSNFTGPQTEVLEALLHQLINALLACNNWREQHGGLRRSISIVPACQGHRLRQLQKDLFIAWPFVETSGHNSILQCTARLCTTARTHWTVLGPAFKHYAQVELAPLL